ncbi:MAG: hypothetical protein HDS84_06960 [Bacteroidales bacterium]|nr:hypothetical protein [Bacteroidales bacterium]
MVINTKIASANVGTWRAMSYCCARGKVSVFSQTWHATSLHTSGNVAVNAARHLYVTMYTPLYSRASKILYWHNILKPRFVYCLA